VQGTTAAARRRPAESLDSRRETFSVVAVRQTRHPPPRSSGVQAFELVARCDAGPVPERALLDQVTE